MSDNNARYSRNPDFIFRTIVDELVLVPIHQDVADMDSIFVLNEVGAFIWELLQQPMNVSEIHTAILEEFDADPDAVMADLHEFLTELSEFGAVARS